MPDPPPDLDSAYVGVDTGFTFHRVAIPGMEELAQAFGEQFIEGYFVGSAAVTSGGLVFVGNDNGFLYVLDALVYGEEVTDEDWKKMKPPRNLYGITCSSPALSTKVDDTGQLWLFITSRYNGGTLWAFTVHEEAE